MYQEYLVSVIITTYNRPIKVERALNSVLNQTYRNLEIILIYDGKNCKITQTKDDRLRIIVNEENKGVQFCRNMGLNIASGEYVVNLDDDDYFSLNKIETFIKVFLKNKYSLITSNYFVINRVGDLEGKFFKKTITKDDILYDNVVGNSVLTRTEYLKEIGGWDQNLSSAQDYDLWIRLIQRYGNAYRLQSFLHYVDQSYTNRITSNKNVLIGYYICFLKHKYLMSSKQIKYNLIKFRRKRKLKNSLSKILFYTPLFYIKYEVKMWLRDQSNYFLYKKL